jgi:hypothetical protein
MNFRTTYFSKTLLILAVFAVFSCSEDDDKITRFRPAFDYEQVDPVVDKYTHLFLDETGARTVDTVPGNIRYRMFQALNYESTSSVSQGVHIEADVLAAMFSNENDPFEDISSGSVQVVASELNNADFNLYDAVASSQSSTDADAVRQDLLDWFEQIEEASHAFEREDATGSDGVSGILTSSTGSKYLVDADGIELAQVIQKSLIGALQLDYIGNVLLSDGLNANNTRLVEGKNYTALEHNWDLAYSMLTLNPIYLANSTDGVRGTAEFGLGSYVWEYNKANYANIYPAFLQGRAAIVNNDLSEVKKQAKFLRTEFEKAIANAALGYLGKYKSNTGTASTDDAVRAHAIGEGIGFIYALRFATIHEADAEFSDAILDDLLVDGFWGLDGLKINAAEEAIKEKFNL